MSIPASLPAAMICLVALAAAHDRRHAAMAAWFGVALALSGWAMLAAPVLLGFAIARRVPVETGLLAILTSAGATLALQAAGLPHTAPPLGVAPILAIASAAFILLAWLRIRPSSPSPILARAIRRSAT